MIEDIADGKEKHRINKKHKVKDYFFYIYVDLKSPLKRDFFFFSQMTIMLKCCCIFVI